MAADGPPKQQSAQPGEMRLLSRDDRYAIIRDLNAEYVFVRKMFPMGMKGLRLRDGEITPGDDELRYLVAQFGAAASPGQRAQITAVVFKDKSITFEINGGPKKHKKWYQHIAISSAGGMTSIAPDTNQNPHGSFVALEFDRHVPYLTPQQVKQLLKPVFDFTALSATEAYIDTMPPKAKVAMKNHEVLVGMDREMVIYTKGAPPQKIREKDELGDYEEWIYGTPPDPVEFVRFYGDQVKRVEIMTVDGHKTVRTTPEVSVSPTGVVQDASAVQAAAAPAPAPQPASDANNPPYHPSLRRPGEEAAPAAPRSDQPAPPPLPVDTSPPTPPPQQWFLCQPFCTGLNWNCEDRPRTD
jgi:hypothetical protein